MSNPEQLPQSPENNAEAPRVSAEHYERLDNKETAERSLESAEKQVEKAKIEALESAISVEKGGAEKDRRPKDSPAARRRGGTVVPKKEKDASYKKRIKQVQEELPPSERAFSKVIHNPIIEKTSEVLGSTVARPNAILAGAVTAFFLVLAVYVLAKTFGYTLSGFETIAAFIVGWAFGLLYDYLRVMITGKKS